jgi:signal transduction histidine kinase
VSPGVRLNFEPDTASNVPETHEALAQSVLAEAIRNVRKHANASEVLVRTRLGNGTFALEVFNDGVDAGRVHESGMGMGLRLAAFEALQVGGIVEFGPRGGDGWQVRLVVPHDG